MRVTVARDADVEFYSAVTGCGLRCDGITNAPGDGYWPRGFFASAERTNVVFLLVGSDPGPSLPGDSLAGSSAVAAREFLEPPRFLSPEKALTSFHHDLLDALLTGKYASHCEIYGGSHRRDTSPVATWRAPAAAWYCGLAVNPVPSRNVRLATEKAW